MPRVLGPYRRPMPRVLGGGYFDYERGAPVRQNCVLADLQVRNLFGRSRFGTHLGCFLPDIYYSMSIFVH